MRVSKIVSLGILIAVSAIILVHVGIKRGPTPGKALTVSEIGRAVSAQVASPKGRGSAVYLGGVQMLTAGHVCAGMDVKQTVIISTRSRIITRVKEFIMAPRWPSVDLCIMVLEEVPTDLQVVEISDQAACFDDQLFLASYSGGMGYSFRSGKQLAEETVEGPKSPSQFICISSIYADPGASGGPVLNSVGKLTGILILKFGETISISGYVPLEQIKEFLAVVNH